MNCLDNKFNNAVKNRTGVLIAYFPLGEPGLDPVEMAETYYRNGVDILEIGFPVPNPFADGQVVTASMHRVLEHDFSPERYFRQLSMIKAAVPDVSLEIFGYSQLFDRVKTDLFYQSCQEAGVDSVLIADADKGLRQEMDKGLPENVYNLRFMPFRYTPSDLEDAAAYGKGYIFLQAADGTTGTRDRLDDKLAGKIAELKQMTPNQPICPGFGIATPEHCRAIMGMGGDGVIIGSRIVDTIYREGLLAGGRLLKQLKEGLKSY